jgi:hypothetical protein
MVVAGPSAQITRPAQGALYVRGSSARASYHCADATAAPGISYCSGTVADGAMINTLTAGKHTFSVNVGSKDGQHSTTTSSYTVIVPDNHFTITNIKRRANGNQSFQINVPGAGQLEILESAWTFNEASVAMRQEIHRFVIARKNLSVNAQQATSIRLTLGPNARGRRLVAHHRGGVLKIRLWVTYQPTGGNPRSILLYGLPVPPA